MKSSYVRTDSFVVKKHNLRIWRVAERGTGTVLWTSEPHAARYVQQLHIRKLLATKQCR